MSKRGKQKKAETVEKRRLQMQEAVECLVAKEAVETQMARVFIKKPKQCSFRHCLRYVDPTCSVCPYCGNPLPAESQPDSLRPVVQPGY